MSQKTHVGKDSKWTFCHNLTHDMRIATPWDCTCRNCLTLYYLQNPLIEKRTVDTLQKRQAWRNQQRYK